MNDQATTKDRGTDRSFVLAAVANDDPALAAVLADGRPFVRCGCDYLAVSDSQEENRMSVVDHQCPRRPVVDDREAAWYSYLFSWSGVAIAFLIAIVLIALFSPAAVELLTGCKP